MSKSNCVKMFNLSSQIKLTVLNVKASLCLWKGIFVSVRWLHLKRIDRCQITPCTAHHRAALYPGKHGQLCHRTAYSSKCSFAVLLNMLCILPLCRISDSLKIVCVRVCAFRGTRNIQKHKKHSSNWFEGFRIFAEAEEWTRRAIVNIQLYTQTHTHKSDREKV